MPSTEIDYHQRSAINYWNPPQTSASSFTLPLKYNTTCYLHLPSNGNVLYFVDDADQYHTDFCWGWYTEFNQSNKHNINDGGEAKVNNSLYYPKQKPRILFIMWGTFTFQISRHTLVMISRKPHYILTL